VRERMHVTLHSSLSPEYLREKNLPKSRFIGTGSNRVAMSPMRYASIFLESTLNAGLKDIIFQVLRFILHNAILH
jgi:hypothetical protein